MASPPSTSDAPLRQDETVDEAAEFWSQRGGRHFTREDAREAAANLAEFFSILREWDAARKDQAGFVDSETVG